jgi:hypothetical protein
VRKDDRERCMCENVNKREKDWRVVREREREREKIGEL